LVSRLFWRDRLERGPRDRRKPPENPVTASEAVRRRAAITSGGPNDDTARTAVIALDVGGTSIKGAVVDRHDVVATERFPTNRADGPAAVVDAILDAAGSLVGTARRQQLDVVAGGLAVLGVVDTAAGIARSAANVGWRDVPLRALAEDRLGLPIALAHDVKAAGHAEATLGAAAGAPSALVVCIGTGIAAAIVLDGVVYSGAAEQAGELGQMLVLAPEGGAARVTLESISSADAMARAYERMAGAPAGTVAATAVIAAAADDPVAASVWSVGLARLCDVLADAVAVIDPARIVIGGGLSLAGSAVCEPVQDGLAERLGWRSAPPVVPARFGDASGWIGAALLAWRAAGDDDAVKGAWAERLAPSSR